jgi:hypothetical protein
MRDTDAAIVEALGKPRTVTRDFLWVTPKNRDTGELASFGLWSGWGDIAAPVTDAYTQSTVIRTFSGEGGLVSIGTLTMVADLTVRELAVTLSQIDPTVETIVREYEARSAPAQVWRGVFDPDTRLLVAPAANRFVGFVDTAEVTTPAEGDSGAIVLNCVSQLREMTRSNPDTRSDESQRKRSTTDSFFQYADVAGGWPIWWGQKKGSVG